MADMDTRQSLGSRLRAALRTQPAIAPIEDDAEMRRVYRTWRMRNMTGMLVGYAAFYLVRKNLSIAMPAMLEDLNYTKTDFGILLSAFSILYGVGKLTNGIIADRANPRYFIAIGLLGAAFFNVAFGLSTSITFLGIFWLGNAWMQSMGWPPCARLLTFWYSPRERGTMWGIWNASHQIGGALILVGGGFLVTRFGWRSAFYVPAMVSALLALFVMHRLRDTPQSLGLPPVEVYRGERTEMAPETTSYTWKEILFGHVLTNRNIWFVCLANLFVYIVRIGMLDWAPTFLVEYKGSSLEMAGWKTAVFELAGIAGALSAGLLSDRIFRGRRGPASVIYMLVLIVAIVLFWRVPPGNPWLDTALLFVIGFAVYGPQMLVGVAAADFASKGAAATATGLTGTFGYIGSALCGVGTGLIVDRWGWDGGFAFYLAAAVIGTFFFTLTWSAQAAGQDEETAPERAETPS